jgi:AcrR family transcriptional regulator
MPRITAARKEERRSQILSAAVRCFARLGFQGATLHDIRLEAGMSIGAVYSYFPSKAAIIAALAETGRRRTAELIGAVEPGAPPAERLRKLLARLERAEDALVYQTDLRAWAEAINEPALREMVLTSQADVVAELAQMVRPLATARGLAPEALAELVAAVIAGSEVRKAIQPDADLSAMMAALLTLLAGEPAA